MVNGKRIGKLGAEVSSISNRVVVDVDASLGGDGAGMDPHRLLEASLAACTIITLQMYANLKKLDLKDVEVSVDIDKEGDESHINRKIKLIGYLTEDQRKRLIEIANRCPLHRMLSHQIKIETSELY